MEGTGVEVGAGVVVWANVAAAHRHTTQKMKEPLDALRYTVFVGGIKESRQDITPFQSLANCPGQENRARDAHRSIAVERSIYSG